MEKKKPKAFLFLSRALLLGAGIWLVVSSIHSITTPVDAQQNFNSSVAASPAISANSSLLLASADDVKKESDADGDSSEEEKGETHVPSLIENLVTLLFLVLLQAVLGFDNLLYISLESRRAPPEKQSMVRTWGIGIAIFLRIALLFALTSVISLFRDPLFTLDIPYFFGTFNVESMIVLAGGTFIIYTAMKEIWHMIRLEHGHGEEEKPKSFYSVIAWIVIMNIVFSFDSILSAMALTDVFWVMTAAIIISGVLMVWLSDHVSTFLAKNRMYEVLGLFILFIVGVMLVTEGGHHAHLKLFGNEVMPMTKTTFYFVLAILVFTDIVQSRYQAKLLAKTKKA